MYGYQIKLVVQKMYMIHELIRTKRWNELSELVKLDCTIEGIIFEIDEYPGELTTCSIEEFFEAITFVHFDGYNILAFAQFWVDGEESDLSMVCNFIFYGRELKSITLETVHVL